MTSLLASLSMSPPDTPASRLDRIAVSLFLSVLGAGTLLAAWLITQDAAKRDLINSFASATENGDIYRLNNTLDWNSVRNNLKHDILANTLRSEAAGLPTQPEVVDQLINYYVRPENIPVLINLYKNGAREIDPRAFVQDINFSGWREITMHVAAPPQFNQPWINRLKPVEVNLVLETSGWKVKRIRPPEYLIPTSAPIKPASARTSPTPSHS